MDSWHQLRWVLRQTPTLLPNLRAVAAAHIPAQAVALLSSHGILALSSDQEALSKLRRGTTLGLPPTDRWAEDGTILATSGTGKVTLRWLAAGTERDSVLSET